MSEPETTPPPELVLDRAAQEEAEERRLQAYACASRRSRGRRVAEDPDPLRTEFQRDRDRIIHSTAFRRLIGKTQVFVSDTGDHYRVRLTHSLEVAQIARSLARSLGLNEDLTEALALAHDLGHAPFGHIGGDVLDELMRGAGGFEHNRQSLRILDQLETKYPAFPGLNLTYEVRESVMKHKRPFEGPDFAPYHPEEGPCLEAQVVDFADGIAYNSHDLDDALRSGILALDDVREIFLWREVEAAARAAHPGAEGPVLQHRIIGRLIHTQVRDLVTATADNLRRLRIRTLADVRAVREPLVGFGASFGKEERALRDFLFGRFYTHYKVLRMRNRARVIISGLFQALRDNPELMPPRFQELAARDGVERAVADYISGMTDRYAQKEYALLFQPGQGSLDP